MKTLNKLALAALGVSAMVSGAVYAGDKEGKEGKSWSSFQKADADSNGAISQDEARNVPGLADAFTSADKNGDGQLSKSEYEAAKKSQKKTKE